MRREGLPPGDETNANKEEGAVTLLPGDETHHHVKIRHYQLVGKLKIRNIIHTRTPAPLFVHPSHCRR